MCPTSSSHVSEIVFVYGLVIGLLLAMILTFSLVLIIWPRNGRQICMYIFTNQVVEYIQIT